MFKAISQMRSNLFFLNCLTLLLFLCTAYLFQGWFLWFNFLPFTWGSVSWKRENEYVWTKETWCWGNCLFYLYFSSIFFCFGFWIFSFFGCFRHLVRFENLIEVVVLLWGLQGEGGFGALIVEGDLVLLEEVIQ